MPHHLNEFEQPLVLLPLLPLTKVFVMAVHVFFFSLSSSLQLLTGRSKNLEILSCTWSLALCL